MRSLDAEMPTVAIRNRCRMLQDAGTNAKSVVQSLLESNAKVQDNGDGTGFSMGDKANQKLRWRAVAKVEAVLALGIQAYSSGTSSNSNKKSTKVYL